MKKIITLLFFFIAVVIKAQTLTQAFNEPVPGDEDLVVRLDTSLINPLQTLTLTGQNVNWNFSLLRTGSDPVSSLYTSSLAVSSASDYPGCNLVQDDNGSYTYLKSVSTPTTRTELLGLTLQGSVVTLTNSAIIANYPIAYGTTFSDNASGTAVFTGSTLPVSGKMSYTADGTGTLTLADGFIYKNVLRIKSVQTFTATYLFLPVVNVTRTSYDFYDASLKFPVLSITYQNFNVFGQANSSGTYVGNANSFTGIKNNGTALSQFSVKPNPSEGVFTLSANWDEACIIRITDAYGRLIQSKQLASNFGSEDIDLSAYASGLYFIQIEAGAKSAQYKLLKN